MKYLALILIFLGLFAPIAHAQTVDTASMTDTELRLYLVTLIQQLIALENQLIALQTQTQQQIALIQPPTQPQVIEPTFTAAPMTKTITISQEKNRIFISYQEDGKEVAGIPVTLNADDNGQISHSSVADKWGIANNQELTNPQMEVFNQPYKIGAVFEYYPTEPGDRTLTVSANGTEQTYVFPN